MIDMSVEDTLQPHLSIRVRSSPIYVTPRRCGLAYCGNFAAISCFSSIGEVHICRKLFGVTDSNVKRLTYCLLEALNTTHMHTLAQGGNHVGFPIEPCV